MMKILVNMGTMSTSFFFFCSVDNPGEYFPFVKNMYWLETSRLLWLWNLQLYWSGEWLKKEKVEVELQWAERE